MCEIELRMFWNIVRDLRDAPRIGADPDDYVEELQAMAMHTQNKKLRRRCRAIIHQHRTDLPRMSGEALN